MIELQKQAKRKSVIDCLSLNIRTMECQLKKLQEDHINAAQEVTQPTAPKRYEIKLNGYGMIYVHLHINTHFITHR